MWHPASPARSAQCPSSPTPLRFAAPVLVVGLLLVFTDVVLGLVSVVSHGAFDADRNGVDVLVTCSSWVYLSVWPLVVCLVLRSRPVGVSASIARAAGATGLTILGQYVFLGPLADASWRLRDPLLAMGGRPLAALAHAGLAIAGVMLVRGKPGAPHGPTHPQRSDSSRG